MVSCPAMGDRHSGLRSCKLPVHHPSCPSQQLGQVGGYRQVLRPQQPRSTGYCGFIGAPGEGIGSREIGERMAWKSRQPPAGRRACWNLDVPAAPRRNSSPSVRSSMVWADRQRGRNRESSGEGKTFCPQALSICARQEIPQPSRGSQLS